MDSRKQLGERLKAERLRLSLIQPAFGEVGGVRKDAQLKYESGKRSPNAEYLAKIAILGVDIHFIITGQRDETRIKGEQEMAYVALCRELPTPEAREAALDTLKLLLVRWVPGTLAANKANKAPETGSLKGLKEILKSALPRLFRQ